MLESVEPISPDLRLQDETHEISSSVVHNSSEKVNEISIANESTQIQQIGDREMNLSGISIPSEADNRTMSGIGFYISNAGNRLLMEPIFNPSSKAHAGQNSGRPFPSKFTE
ncbi:hypothetical protein L2E82_16647 [Cichorium intybus]|uniref:Uncharacterized protein n=1 Tax=Cichorium intybus TaxID=13427 RepID=A0ACB9F5G0_CICIN|nr:hypothetical protein L2E82_16647 [Cichorium intybus]